MVKAEPAPVAAKKPVSSGKIKSLKQKLEKLDKSMAALHAEKAAFEARLGGTLSLKEFFKAGNLRLPFEKGMLKELMGEILIIEPLV